MKPISEGERSVPALAPAPGHEGEAGAPSDTAYAPIEAGALWEILSLGCFTAALLSRFVVRWLFPPPQPYFSMVFLPALTALGLAFLGLVLGLVGLGRSRRPGLAKAGIFLNGVVLLLGALLVFAFFKILPR